VAKLEEPSKKGIDMPKENRIDNHSTDDLNDHLSAVEKSIKKLRKRLKHYFKKDEVVRTRFTAIEKQVLDFSSDCRAEVERIVKGQSAKKTSKEEAAPKARKKRAKITPTIKDGIIKALNEEKSALAIAAEFKVSVASVNLIKKAAGLTKARK